MPEKFGRRIPDSNRGLWMMIQFDGKDLAGLQGKQHPPISNSVCVQRCVKDSLRRVFHSVPASRVAASVPILDMAHAV